MELRPSRRRARIVFAAVVAGALAVWLLRGPASEPVAGSARALPDVGAGREDRMQVAQVRLPRRDVGAPPDAVEARAEPPPRAEAPDRDERFWRETADIEDFKRAIYALEIDTIDDIPKLDALVHLDVEDPETLWDTDWAGVDDWKRYQDGFSLERAPDGTLLFHPGEETQRMFTFFEGISVYDWDESNEAFVNRVDYYGKPIYNVVKFLREDVLVMMTISGHKVDTNVFEQGSYR